MKRILLIDPLGFSKGYNIGLGYLASMVKNNGHEIRVLDFQNMVGNEEKRLEDALAWGPDIIGISVFHMTLPESKRIISKCKEKCPNALFVAGGPAPTLKAESFFQDEENRRLFDVTVLSEGENTFLDIANGKDMESIDGIIYQKDGGIKTNNPRKLAPKLDEFPKPDYTVFDSFPGKMDVYKIITSRGCPQNCVFCANKIIFKRVWRGHSPEYVIDEIKHAIDTYKTRTFAFWDSSFSQDMDRAKKICDMIVDEKLDIVFSMPDGVRADRLDRELLEKMKRAGCLAVNIGIEDGCPKTFPFINKGETLQQIEDTVKLLKEVGIGVRASMIIGAINATFETTMESIKFIKKLGIEAHWYLAVPYEGTALYDWVKQNGIPLTDFENFTEVEKIRNSYEPFLAFETEEFRKEERLRAFFIANSETKNFYSLALDGAMADVSEKDSAASRAARIIKRTWKYNRKKTPHSLFYVGKETLKKIIS